MFKITTDINMVKLCGRFTGEYVPEVEKALSQTSTGQKKPTLDLTEVTLVDRAAIMFLCAARSRNIVIQNAPFYVGLWMEQENCKSPIAG